MVTLDEIKEEIEEIRNSDFRIGSFNFCGDNIKYSKLLRLALLCFCSICNIQNVSEEEKDALRKKLDTIMKNKLKELNPDFSEEVLSNMIKSYYRGNVKYPMDILVVDDAVFLKEGTYDEFGRIDEIKTFMFDDMKPYYDMCGVFFTFDVDFDNLFDYQERLTKKEQIFTTKFITNQINFIYGKNIIRPLYELNNCSEYSGIAREYGCYWINVYINSKHADIGRSLKYQQECDIKFCIQAGDDIILYTVHQSFNGNKPVWSVKFENRNVWRLTEAASKNRKEDSPKLMSKKRTLTDC